MRRLFSISFLTILSALILGLPVTAGVPFDAERGLVEIPVVINGFIEGRFGIDTGADRLYIDDDLARRYNLLSDSIPAQRKVAGVDGSTSGRNITLRSLGLGDVHLYNLRATVIDINALNRDRDGNHPDGLIGFEVLRQLYVTVDYPNRQIDLEYGRPRFLSGRQFEAIPYESYRHLILVDVTFPDGQQRPMILDYCAGVSSISSELAGELGLSSDPELIQSVSTLSVGEGLSTDEVMVVVRDLSDYRRSLGGVRFDGILGASFLYRHKITINYKEQRIYLHR